MQSNLGTNRAPQRKCSFKRWELVLHGDESDPKFNEAVVHVESCPECQSRIEGSAAADMPWWSEAKESWLEYDLPTTQHNSTQNSVIIEIEPEMPADSRIEFESVSLSFLEKPSHPELLGRLGRYEIEKVIGQGGMGIVLKAHDTELHRVVAIKVLAAHLANNASARKRFAREAQAAAAVLHPNVIPIYNVESDGKLPYLVMQCVSGCSLQSKVDHDGSLPLADTLRIAKQTAAGLSAAHDQGLVHRDVKPANILLEDNVDRVLLSDFGLARAVDDASLTRTGVIAGTPHYMSPEQARGDAIDTRSDQFSLGSVLYFMLTGRPPFRANGAMGVLHRICTESHRSIEQLNSDVPREVAELIDRLLEKDSTKRFPSMHAVELELERLLAALQSGGLSLAKRNRSKRETTKNFRWKLLAAAAIPIVAMAILASVLEWPWGQHRNEPSAPADMAEVRSQLQSQIQTDARHLIETLSLESEISALRATSSSPVYATSDNFDETVRAIQSQIDSFERQFPFPKLEMNDEMENR